MVAALRVQDDLLPVHGMEEAHPVGRRGLCRLVCALTCFVANVEGCDSVGHVHRLDARPRLQVDPVIFVRSVEAPAVRLPILNCDL